MVVNVVVGTQWGDEGKGKIVDYLSKEMEYVVRFQGGNNAGHTIKIKDDVYKLHIIPSGVLQGKVGVIGNGCVIDPEVLVQEINELTKKGITPRLLISDRAHIIMSYHKILDGAEEAILGNQKIGTTKRGIGPCYSDKIARFGIRTTDLITKERLKEKLSRIVPIKQRLFQAYGIQESLDEQQLIDKYYTFGKQLQPYIVETHVILQHALQQQKSILFEGAQGTMLDVDFGTYPYTTSSHVIAGGIATGSGIGPNTIDEIIGIMKAYTTRVGQGPFPTELSDAIGKHLQNNGHEYGTTTSRPRRCGWLDLIVVKHACGLSGITKLAVTKLDVLTGLDSIKICVGYEYHKKQIDTMPASLLTLKDCRPLYKEFKGWKTLPDHLESKEDLPREAQQYLDFIEIYLSVPISIISYGPERNETMTN